jgi:hypothetical protein
MKFKNKKGVAESIIPWIVVLLILVVALAIYYFSLFALIGKNILTGDGVDVEIVVNRLEGLKKVQTYLDFLVSEVEGRVVKDLVSGNNEDIDKFYSLSDNFIREKLSYGNYIDTRVYVFEKTEEIEKEFCDLGNVLFFIIEKEKKIAMCIGDNKFGLLRDRGERRYIAHG